MNGRNELSLKAGVEMWGSRTKRVKMSISALVFHVWFNIFGYFQQRKCLNFDNIYVIFARWIFLGGPNFYRVYSEYFLLSMLVRLWEKCVLLKGIFFVTILSRLYKINGWRKYFFHHYAFFHWNCSQKNFFC